MNILLAGGSGLIGRSLMIRLLADQHHITLLSRRPAGATRSLPDSVAVLAWDARSSGPWTDQLERTDAVINLSGESVAARRWNKRQKQRLVASRLDSTRALVNAIGRARRRPHLLVNASAIGYYGNVPDGIVTEADSAGTGFFPDLCRRWEAEAMRAEEFGLRVVVLRTGLFLDRKEGALPRFLIPMRLFAGGPVGSGHQGVTWIHRDDAVRAVSFILGHERLSGPVNLTAPGPVSMREFARTLGQVLHRPSWIRIPQWSVRLVLGEMAGPLVLEGQRVLPEKLLSEGFQFSYPTLLPALQNILQG